MHRAARWALMGWLVVACLPLPAQPAPAPTLSLHLVPKSIVDGHQADLLMTVESSQLVSDVSLQVSAPSGFEAKPDCFVLPAFSGRVIQRTVIRRADDRLLAGERPVIVELAGRTAGASNPCGAAKSKILASQSLTFEYSPEIRLREYLLLGMLGVGLGWMIRFFISILKSIPPPLPAPAESSGEGGWTIWVKRHYYLVDCLVTLGIGLVVLVTLAKGGRPPEAAALWPGALAAGVGLGLLTNSDLLTRLR